MSAEENLSIPHDQLAAAAAGQGCHTASAATGLNHCTDKLPPVCNSLAVASHACINCCIQLLHITCIQQALHSARHANRWFAKVVAKPEPLCLASTALALPLLMNPQATSPIQSNKPPTTAAQTCTLHINRDAEGCIIDNPWHHHVGQDGSVSTCKPLLVVPAARGWIPQHARKVQTLPQGLDPQHPHNTDRHKDWLLHKVTARRGTTCGDMRNNCTRKGPRCACTTKKDSAD